MTSKALRPLPVAHRPPSEETRVRQRYVELIVRPLARPVVRQRAAVVHSIRETSHGHDFIEIETPMLQLQAGGAKARPFVTPSNATGLDLYLRIAPELFLKRAVVGGLEKVLEINRNSATRASTKPLPRVRDAIGEPVAVETDAGAARPRGAMRGRRGSALGSGPAGRGNV